LALLRFLLFFQHCLDVPGQQRLDLLDGAGSGQMLEQIVQVRVRLHFIRAAGHDRARRVSGRSEAQSLDEPPALRTITWGKMEVTAFLVGARPLLEALCTSLKSAQFPKGPWLLTTA
jgi:hypothetical protein